MTKINKSELMSRAWELSKIRMNNFNKTSKINKSVKFFFSCSLEIAWGELKESLVQEKKESFSAPVKLLERSAIDLRDTSGEII